MPNLHLTDGGLETSLIFRQGVELPEFAAYPLVADAGGRAALEAYWAPYLAVGRELGVPMLVDSPTWRANPDWGARLGHDRDRLRSLNAAAVGFARDIARQLPAASVNGVVGPRGDGYVVTDTMSADEAADYHSEQLAALVDAGVDQVSALTFTYPDEAIGFVRAAAALTTPAVVSFTVETDGNLPSGHSLRDAIGQVDAATRRAAAGFMVNCAHPTHFDSALTDGEWLARIVGVRPNASALSHAEIDAADTLDDGDPDDLAQRCRALADRLPSLNVLGGCCGTDERHVRALATACLATG
jgi:S-methylmethionine-dependent homocysteine/selenocysteine methylase